ncbi:tandem-95 repeat protein [Phormidium sp. CLA17]|uniref:tandem-95 repeat protein n=1 Tax=Leptolyngbya sp. Cla-17 TaxID=2803751 RepID=UPI0014920005|nr:Ig-like domain-containing protein [Leptolyngbya sp. Cla-17]MBM0744200.1 tandem-95 repeat protein [Leptolyngbya sp. Cla-17]
MPDTAGNTLATATPLKLLSTTQNFSDLVTPAANDFYRFSLENRSSFNLSLTGLDADANVALLDSAGNLVSVNGVGQLSTNQGRFAESINTTLDAGVYYIQVAPGTNTPTANYTLNVAAQTAPADTDLLWRNFPTATSSLWSLDDGALLNIQPSALGAEFIPPWIIRATGDFNQDGQTDLLWRDDNVGATYIRLFKDNIQDVQDVYFLLPTKSSEWRVVGAGDFNDDSQTDIVWWNSVTSRLEVWAMQGVSSVGTIAIPQQQEFGWTARGVGDFNRDGSLDILWQNDLTTQAEVWFFNQTTFLAEASLSAGLAAPWQIAGVADFNRDGSSDILWRYYGEGGENQIWFMNGTTFVSSTDLLAVNDVTWVPIPYSTYGEPVPIDVAGNTPATAFNLGSGLGQSATYRDRVGGLDPNDYYRFDITNATQVSLSLTNLTGNVDLQLLDGSGNTILGSSTLNGLSPESLTQQLAAGTYYVRVLPALNQAGSYTLSINTGSAPVPNTAGNTLATATPLKLLSTTQNFSDLVTFAANDFYRFSLENRSSFNLSLTGLDADANVALLDSAGNLVSVNGMGQLSTNQGRFAESINTTLDAGVYYIQVAPGTNTPTANYTLNVSAADNLLDTDLLWRNYQSRAGSLWELNENGVLLDFQPSALGAEFIPPWIIRATGDFNQDGQTDLLWRDDNVGATYIRLFKDNIQDVQDVYFLLPTKSSEWRVVGAGDFNDDSQTDIVWWNSVTSRLEVWAMQGVSSVGTIAIPQQQEFGWTARGVGDFNRDGSLDILWQNDLTTQAEVWFFNQTTFLAEASLSAGLAAPWQIAGVADFNRDGSSDILWRYYGEGGENQIWFMNGTTFVSSTDLLAVNDVTWVPIPYSTYGEPVPIDVAGNTPATAFNLGSGLGQSATYRDRVGGLDPNDYYRFDITNATQVSLSLTNLTGNVDLQLLDGSGNTILGSSSQSGLSPESIIRPLPTGTYYARVFPALGQAESLYTLSVNITSAPVLVSNNLLTVDEDGSAIIKDSLLLVTDSDTPENQLIYTVGNSTTNGNLLINGVTATAGTTFTQANLDDPSQISYIHNGSETTSDRFSFSVTDGTGGSISNQTFSIQVNPVNDAPILVSNSGLTLSEGDSTILSPGLLLISDVDSPAISLQYSITTLPTNGTLLLAGTATNTFTQNDIFNGLVRYQHSGSESTFDRFTFTVTDGAILLPGSNTFSISVLPVNDAPTVSINTALTLSEGTSAVITPNFLLATDADGPTPVAFTLGSIPTNGALRLGTATLLAGQTFTQLDIASGQLTYSHNGGETTSDRFQFTVTDGLGATSAATTFSIAVLAVNDAPTLTVPSTLLVDQSTNTLISGIRLTDADLGDNDITVSLSASSGLLTLGRTTGVTFLAGGGTQDSTISFRGRQDVANFVLESLIYRSTAAFEGTDVVSVAVSDGGNFGLGGVKTDSKNITLTVAGVNDAPVITAPALQTFSEDATSPISGISIADSDAGVNPLTVSLSVANGTLTLGSTSGLTVTTGSGTLDKNLAFSGSQGAINAALAGLTYLSDRNYNGSDLLTMNVSDNGFSGNGIPLSASKLVTLTITPVNDAPVITVPSTSQIVNEGTDLRISGISINDVDVSNGNLTVAVSAVSGLLSLQSLNGLTFTTGDGNQDNTLIFQGSQSAVNAALSALTYRPNANFGGADTISVSVTDGGNSGTGIPLSDSKSITVTALGINNPPVITLPAATPAVNSGVDVTIAGFSIADPDAGGGILSVTVFAENGVLSLRSLSGLQFTQGTGIRNNRITFTGSIAAINDALSQVTYRSYVGFANASDRITLSVNDNGNTGVGAPLSDTKTLLVDVGNAVNLLPVAAADSFTVAEQGTLLGTSVLANDSDPDFSLPLTAQLVNQPTNAVSFTLNPDGTFAYIPTANFNGFDTFSYVASDVLGGTSNPAIAVINVTSVNDLPVAIDDSVTTPEDQLVSGNVLINDTDVDNLTSSLSAQLISSPVNAGSFSLNPNGSFSYTPLPNFNGVDRFTYVAIDPLGGISNTAIVSLTITAANDVPVATNDGIYSTGAGGTLSVSPANGILQNDTDAEGSALTATVVTGPNNGTLSLSGDGSFVYRPTGSFAGIDIFTYRASDGNSASSVATVTLSVNPNNAPIVQPDLFVGAEDGLLTTGNVLTNDTDIDGNIPLTATLVAAPTNALSFTLRADGSFSYQPTPNFSGSDTFTYRAIDSLGGASSVAIATFSVTPVNDAPVAVNDAYSVSTTASIQTAPGVLANDTDTDGPSLTAVLVANVQNGTLSLNPNGAFTYQPNTGFSGSDRFTYVANDGSLNSTNTATVNLLVTTVVNAPPVANPDLFTISEDLPLSVVGTERVSISSSGNQGLDADNIVNADYQTDISGDGRYVVFSTDASGLVAGDTNSKLDIFLRDRQTGTTTLISTTTGTASPSDDSYSPVISNDGRYVVFYSKAPDINAQGLPYSGLPSVYVYDNQTGITRRIADNTLEFSGNSTNAERPAISSDGRFIAYETGTVFAIGAGKVFVYDQQTGISTEIGSGRQPSISDDGRYVAFQEDFSNPSVKIFLFDRQTNTTTTIATPNGIFAVRDLSPDGRYMVFTSSDEPSLVPGDTNGQFDVFVFDRQTGQISLISVDSNGNQGDGGSFTPTISANGRYVLFHSLARNLVAGDTNNVRDVFVHDRLTGQTTRVSLDGNGQQGNGSSLQAQISADGKFVAFTSDATNLVSGDTNLGRDVFVATLNTSTAGFSLGNVLTNDTDIDGNIPLTASLVAAPSNALSFTLRPDGSFSYQPTLDFNGVDTFTYRAIDSLGGVSSIAIGTISITAVNDAPVAVNDVYSVNTTASLSQTAPGVLANDTDSDSPSLTAVLVSGVQNGTLSLSANGSFTYQPNTGFSGSDRFTYVANDGSLNSTNTATVNLLVTTVVNAPPVANPDLFTTAEDALLTTGNVLTNDTDSDGNIPLTATLVAAPTNALSFTLRADGSFSYQPTPNFSGSDTFTYRAIDSLGGASSVAIATFSVTPVNDAPVAVNDAYSVSTTASIQTAPGVLANDTDADGPSLTAVLVADVQNGTLSLNPNGAFTYQPNTGFSGSDRFTYVANDGSLNSTNTATVNLLVTTVVNAPPVANADLFTTAEDTLLTTGNVLTNDTDTDGNIPLTATLIAAPTNALSFTLRPNGSFSYQPTPNFSGLDTFTYRAIDSLGGASSVAIATFSVTGGGTNAAPTVALPGSQLTLRNTDLLIPSGLSIGDVDAGTNPITATLTATNGALTLGGISGLTFTTGDGTADTTMSFTGAIAAINTALTNLKFTPTNNFVGAAQIGLAVNDGGFTGAGGAQTGSGTVSINVSSGAALVANISPGATSSSPTNLAAAGNLLYFAADDGTTGIELWQSDGTSTATRSVTDINPGGSSSSPSGFTAVGNTIYFTAINSSTGRELWKTDLAGTSATLVNDLRSGVATSNPTNLVNFNNTLFFQANDGSGSAIFQIDSSGNPVKLVSSPSYSSLSTIPGNLTVVGDTLYFTANNARQLWKTDGTNANTVLVKDIGSSPNAPIQQLTAVGDTVFFTAIDSSGRELWRSDGTGANTARVADLNSGNASSNPSDLVNVDGTLYFFARDVAGFRLWQSTTNGTINSGISLPAANLAPSGLTAIGSKLFFTVDAGTVGNPDLQLWSSDGVSTATLVRSINGAGNDTVASLTNFNGSLYFTANDGTGSKVYRSDGTSAGTVAVSGNFLSTPAGLTVVNDKLFFAASDATNGTELWAVL